MGGASPSIVFHPLPSPAFPRAALSFAPMIVELRCLGPLEVRVDGEPPPPELQWRKHLALLVYLARSPRGGARDHLMGLLWSEKDQE